MTTDLPEYENPPVNEVVCGVQFHPIEGLRIPHFGLFWESLRGEYPTCQEVAPIIPMIERFDDGEAEISAPNEIPLPRVWLVKSDDTGIVQLQRDRFLHNWKKGQPSDAYPRYEAVMERFEALFTSFDAFVAKEHLGEMRPLQYEMTYVNQIPKGDGWETVSELSKVFRDYSWQSGQRFLPDIEHVNLRKTFSLPDRNGRVHVSIRDGKRREDGWPLILFEFTVRGFPADPSQNTMRSWFDLAHEWIVRGFTDLTTEAVQKNVWRRTR